MSKLDDLRSIALYYYLLGEFGDPWMSESARRGMDLIDTALVRVLSEAPRGLVAR